jgi:uncharacterized protein
MADPEAPTGATPERRDRRRDRTRRRIRRAVTVVAAVAVVAAIALVAFDVVHFGGNDKPSAAGTVESGAHHEQPLPATTTTGARSCRPLSSADPLRLWVGGDSLAGSLGPSLGTIAGATGVVQPYFDSRVSSGLSSPGFFDWPDHATTEMARLDPEVVVFIIGTNDWTAVSGDWKDDYSATVDSMMKTLVGSGRTVYWLGAPTLKDKEKDDAVVEVNSVFEEVAKRNPKVHYVDTYKLFSDSDGTFSYDLPDETGKVVTMRGGDGVHFTTDGADYLARQVFKLVDAQCAVTEQKVDGATKQTIETEGSTQVAPGSSSGTGSSSNSSGSGSSGSSGSSGNSGGTIQTTPPATAPPTTQPVVTTPAPPTTPTTTTTATAPVHPQTGGTPTG